MASLTPSALKGRPTTSHFLLDAAYPNDTLTGYKQHCPFLKSTSAHVLRQYSVASIDGVSRLRVRAQACPVMGPALNQRIGEIQKLPLHLRKGYASVADRSTVDAIHRQQGHHKRASGHSGVPASCPHAAAGIAAAQRARELATAHNLTKPALDMAYVPPPVTPAASSTGTKFQYADFYANELDKKHKDKSYRCVL